MSDSDAIECRIRTWVNIIPDSSVTPNTMRVRAFPFEWVMLMNSAVMARIDGGDPGDEDNSQ